MDEEFDDALVLQEDGDLDGELSDSREQLINKKKIEIEKKYQKIESQLKKELKLDIIQNDFKNGQVFSSFIESITAKPNFLQGIFFISKCRLFSSSEMFSFHFLKFTLLSEDIFSHLYFKF